MSGTPAQGRIETASRAVARAFAGRRGTLIFTTVILAGIAAAFGLGIAEVYSRPPVDIGEERVRRDGLIATVHVPIRNRLDQPVCTEIRIAARDREGFDLEEVVAEPDRHTGPLAPGQTVTYIGVFEALTEEDYREKLDEFTAYAFRAEPCPPEGEREQR